MNGGYFGTPTNFGTRRRYDGPSTCSCSPLGAANRDNQTTLRPVPGVVVGRMRADYAAA